MEKKENFLNVSEAATFLNLSKQTVYIRTSKKQIPHYKNGKLYFKESELSEYLERNRVLTNEEIKEKIKEEGINYEN